MKARAQKSSRKEHRKVIYVWYDPNFVLQTKYIIKDTKVRRKNYFWVMELEAYLSVLLGVFQIFHNSYVSLTEPEYFSIRLLLNMMGTKISNWCPSYISLICGFLLI